MKQKQSFIEIKKNDYNNWQVEQKCKNSESVEEKNFKWEYHYNKNVYSLTKKIDL